MEKAGGLKNFQAITLLHELCHVKTNKTHDQGAFEFQVKPGSFPASHGMEEAGRLRSAWGESENNPRAKCHCLMKAGRVNSKAGLRIGIASCEPLPGRCKRHRRRSCP